MKSVALGFAAISFFVALESEAGVCQRTRQVADRLELMLQKECSQITKQDLAEYELERIQAMQPNAEIVF